MDNINLETDSQAHGRRLEAETPPISPAIFDTQASLENAQTSADALFISERRYRRLFETARDGILILDNERGAITDANPFMTELLGYSHDELIGKELWEIGLLKNKEASQEAFRQLERDSYIRYENLPLENQRGERREVEFVSNVYREDGHMVIQCNIRDITERKQIERALQTSEAHYRRLFETAYDGVLILNVDTGAIMDANPSIVELLGFTHHELIGKELWQIGVFADQEASRSAFRQLQAERYIRYDDLPLQTRSGELREVKFISNVYIETGRSVIQCNIRDITERKRVERALEAVLARERHIAETLQRSMLQVAPAGKFPGISVETLYAAALNEADVGGDFYDAFALTGGKVALVVGDVSGKGLIAAGRTAEVKYALRALLHEYQEPEIALARLNEFICETHRLDEANTEAFIVLALTIVDTALGLATFSAAGSEPTLVLRASGAIEHVEIVGFPLGIQAGATYLKSILTLEPGATVVMATDGVTEARRGSDFLGIDGMAAIVAGNGPGTTLAELTQAIFGGARDFAGGALRDDTCILVGRLGLASSPQNPDSQPQSAEAQMSAPYGES